MVPALPPSGEADGSLSALLLDLPIIGWILELNKRFRSWEMIATLRGNMNSASKVLLVSLALTLALLEVRPRLMAGESSASPPAVMPVRRVYSHLLDPREHPDDDRRAAQRWVKENGQPGVMHTPVALLLDFYSGWAFPRHLYSGDVYRVWGNRPYDPGDYLTDAVLDLLYPGY